MVPTEYLLSIKRQWFRRCRPKWLLEKEEKFCGEKNITCSSCALRLLFPPEEKVTLESVQRELQEIVWLLHFRVHWTENHREQVQVHMIKEKMCQNGTSSETPYKAFATRLNVYRK